MYRKFSMKILLVLIAFFLMPAYVFADEVGKITYIEGRVDTFKQNDKNSQVAREYDTLSVGDSIRTKSNSKAEIKFKDGTILRLAQNSKIRIEDYQFDQKGKRKRAAVALERGKIRTIIAKMPQAADFDIVTPNAKGIVKGSDIFAYYQAGASGMLVAEGALSVVNMAHPETPTLIPSGNSVIIPLEKLPEGPRPYLDLEEKLHEQDTNIPFSAVKSQKISTITAQIAKFQGEVKVVTKGQASAHLVKLNEVLMEGDEIQTGANGLAEIRLDNSNALNLKPNTKLLIVKLVFNPQTREYENIFEVTMGKVKARVEGMKGKSKFEIKTPLAICGVRGTILYVNVSPDGTTTLVEGGNGYITHLISGITQNLSAGQNSSANGQGGVSNPVQTGQGEREGFTEGWDFGNGTEGYSAPGGTTSITYNTNTQINNGIINTGTGEGTNQPVDVPVEPLVEEPVTLNGAFEGAFGRYEYTLDSKGLVLDCGTINNGVIAATGDIWAGSSQAIALTGDFNFTDITSNHDLDLWTSTEDLNLAALTADGSSLFGIIGGIKNNNSLKGISYAFYIKPDGTIGYTKSADLAGSLSGMPSETLVLAGTVTTHQMGTGNSLEIQGFSENELMSGKVTGDISGVMDIGHSFSKGQNWGLWRMSLGGSNISTSLSNNWSANVGGKDVDGDDTFYFLMDINGNFAGNNELSATISGMALDYDSTGSVVGYLTTITDGEFRGIYEQGETDSWWEAIAAGVYTEAPLVFGGKIFNERYDVGFSIDGLFGGTNSLWEGSPEVKIIGDFSLDGQTIWNADLEGRTADGAKLFGFGTGSNVNGSLKGISYIIYIKPNGETGYIKSTDLAGNTYLDIDMFQADGHFTAIPKGITSISPNDLYYDSTLLEKDDVILGLVSGTNFSGSMNNGEDIYLDGQDPWDIWRIESSGTYTSVPGSNWGAVMGGFKRNGSNSWDDYYIMHLTGSAWSGNEISGSITGKLLNFKRGGEMLWDESETLTGDFLGTYGEGNWQITSLGVSDNQLLQYGSILEGNGEATGNFAYYNTELNGTVWDASSHITGLLGSTDSLWAASSQITIIGEFSNPLNYKLWAVDLNGYTKDDGTGQATFSGITGGSNLSNSLKGLLYAFYIKADGSTGYLKSTDISGEFYPGINMFEAYGVSAFTLMGETSVLPADLFSNIDDDNDNVTSGSIGGDISGTIELKHASIEGQDWGLWKAALGGTIQNPLSNNWSAVAGGKENSDSSLFYFLMNINGTSAGNNELSATISGKGIDYDPIANEGYLTTISDGTFLGIYDASNNWWEALAAGVYTESPLMFASSITVIEEGYMDTAPATILTGILGSAESAFSGSPVEFTFMGDYYLENDNTYHIWGTDLRSNNNGDIINTTYDGGAYYGMIGGLFKSSTIEGKLISIYVDEDGKAGIISGVLSDGVIYSDIDMFKTSGTLTAKQKAITELGDMSPADYLKNTHDGGYLEELNLKTNPIIEGYGGGGYENLGEGAIRGEISQNDSTVFNISNQHWGIWGATIKGNYTNLGLGEKTWGLGLGGEAFTAAYDSVPEPVSCWLGTLSISEVADSKLTGNFNGFFFSEAGDGDLDVSTISGDASGYVEAGDGGVTWQTGAIGDWVEVAQLNPGFSWNELQEFVSNPIMEEYSTLENLETLQLFSATSGITSAAMDMNLYVSPAADYGIWTAIINGNYAANPGSGWGMTLANGSNNITLNNGTWADNKWTADVSGGMVHNHPILSGQAAGTYTGIDSGTFTGVGAGKYSTIGE